MTIAANRCELARMPSLPAVRTHWLDWAPLLALPLAVIAAGNRLPPWAFMWGRHQSPKAVFCERCGWAGPYRWLVHGYAPLGDDDVEPQDECPRCGSADTSPVLWDGKAWGS